MLVPGTQALASLEAGHLAQAADAAAAARRALVLAQIALASGDHHAASMARNSGPQRGGVVRAYAPDREIILRWPMCHAPIRQMICA